MRRAVSIGLVFVLCACPSSLRRPADKRVSLAGTVYIGGTVRRGDPVGGAKVVVTRAADGAELATAEASSSGGWLLQFSAEAGTRVVVAFRAQGLAPNFRSLVVGPYTEAQLSVALEPPEPLECTDNHCVSAIDDASLADVADDRVGGVRVFEPSTELTRMAGLEPLRPLAVAWFALDAGPDAGLQFNDAGDTADAGALDAGYFDAGTFQTLPPQLKVRVPLAAWRKLEDTKPGTAQLDVAFLGLDEARGAWTVKADGWLETERGARIPESALPAIRNGSFAGGVVAVASVPSTGYWSLALPAASPGCLTGKVEAEGQSAEGALVTLEGAEPVTSKADGTFCLSAPVVAGGAVGLQYAGLSYGGPTVDGPPGAGTCGGSCTAVGTLSVTVEKARQAKVCKVTGTAVDAAGEPVGGAVVLGFDDSVGGNAFNTLCGKLGTRCSLSTAADDQGAFSLSVPLLDGLVLTSSALVEKPGVVEASRRGTLLLRECPTDAVQVKLLAGRDKLDAALTVTAGSIAWTPAKAAMNLRVTDAQGIVKWEVEALGGFSGPVGYGQVPAGATQLSAGTPPALATGDEVIVLLEGTGTDGYQYSGSAAATLP